MKQTIQFNLQCIKTKSLNPMDQFIHGKKKDLNVPQKMC